MQVIFWTVNAADYEIMFPETIIKLREQYSRSLYPLFIFAAISALLSFCYIFGSTKSRKSPTSNAGKAMLAIGVSGFACSLCGIFFGRYAGENVPLVATWAAISFGFMLVSGIVGLSRRRSPSFRTYWGFAHLAVFTFCMLQTIYYAYSAVVQGVFFYYGSFIWITVLSGTIAVSTILSASYIAGEPKA